MARMMRVEAFKKRIVKVMRYPGRGVQINPGVSADSIMHLPVISKDKATKARLIKELRNIDKTLRSLHRRYRRAADALERLTVSRALMPHPWGGTEDAKQEE